MGIDKLLDLLMEFWESTVPFTVIRYYDRGLRLRFGHPRGVLEPGFHWKWPFADEILTHMIKPTTINLPEQTVTTKDEKSVVIKAVIKYEVQDVEKLLLEVNGPIEAIADMVSGIIRDTIIQLEWKDCNNLEISNVITKRARVEARRWGLGINEVTLTDLGIIRSIRVIHGT